MPTPTDLPAEAFPCSNRHSTVCYQSGRRPPGPPRDCRGRDETGNRPWCYETSAEVSRQAALTWVTLAQDAVDAGDPARATELIAFAYAVLDGEPGPDAALEAQGADPI